MFSCVPVQMEVSRYSRHQALQLSRYQLLQTLHHMNKAVSKLKLAEGLVLCKLTSTTQPYICCGMIGQAGQTVVNDSTECHARGNHDSHYKSKIYGVSCGVQR